MPEQAIQARLCPRCGASLEDAYLCSCGSLVIDRPRARYSGNRPAQREIARVRSETGGGGHYRVRQNPDGSLSCDCPGFLTQTPRELREGLPFAVCKHIAGLIGSCPAPVPAEPLPGPSAYQKALLAGLGITPSGSLTNDQAYHLVADLIGQQGITYPDFVAKVRAEGAASVLPIWSVGWEFECGVARSFGELGFIREANGAGFAVERGCRMSPGAWVLGHDGSVRVDAGYVPIELKSPKCYGAKGFAEMEGILTLLNGIGSTVNDSCGFHTHINAGYLDRGQVVNVLGAWVAVEKRFLWGLVRPSRRGNRYAKPVPAALARRVANRGPDVFTDRYHSLNLCSLRSHGSLEVRLFHGTTDPRTARCWTVLMLKLIEAVAVKGVEPRRFSEVASGGTFEDLLDLIGMAERTATAPIREAREWALEAYQASGWEAERLAAPALAEEDPPQRRRPRSADPCHDLLLEDGEREWARVCSLYEGQPFGRAYIGSSPAPEQPAPDSVYALSRLTAAVRIPAPVILAGLHAGRWVFGLEGEIVTTWDRERDALSCNCPEAAQGPCRHAIFAARFIAIARDARPQAGAELPGAPRPHVLLALALGPLMGLWTATGRRAAVFGDADRARLNRLAGEALDALPRRPGANREVLPARVGAILQALTEASARLRWDGHPVESQTVKALANVIARAAGEIPARLWDNGLDEAERRAAVNAILTSADLYYLLAALGRPQDASVQADGRPDSVATLSRLAPGSGRRYPPAFLRPVIEAGGNTWEFPGEREGARGCTVTWDREQDTLACTCQGFRRLNVRRCRHTVCVARYMTAVRAESGAESWARFGLRLASPSRGDAGEGAAETGGQA